MAFSGFRFDDVSRSDCGSVHEVLSGRRAKNLLLPFFSSQINLRSMPFLQN